MPAVAEAIEQPAVEQPIEEAASVAVTHSSEPAYGAVPDLATVDEPRHMPAQVGHHGLPAELLAMAMPAGMLPGGFMDAVAVPSLQATLEREIRELEAQIAMRLQLQRMLGPVRLSHLGRVKALWIRVDAHKVDSREVCELADALNIDVVQALGHVVALGGAIAEHTDDGNIADVPDVAIERWARWTGKRGNFAPVLRRTLQSENGEYDNWREDMGQLVERRTRDRNRKTGKTGGNSTENGRKPRGNSTESGRDSAATERYGTERDGTGRNNSASSSSIDNSKRRSGSAAAEGAASASGSGPGAAAAAPLASASAIGTADDLPPNARQFLQHFYAGADDERRADVEQQLIASLSDVGVRLDRNTRVFAGSAARLDRKCREVIVEGVNNPDRAIRVLLIKLSDTSDGGAPGQIREAEEQLERAQDDSTRAADLLEANAWIEARPDLQQSIENILDADYPDAANDPVLGMSRRIARESLVLSAWKDAGSPRQRSTP